MIAIVVLVAWLRLGAAGGLLLAQFIHQADQRARKCKPKGLRGIQGRGVVDRIHNGGVA